MGAFIRISLRGRDKSRGPWRVVGDLLLISRTCIGGCDLLIHSQPMPHPPLSAYQETLGMTYFARMLDKIRLHAAGELREDFHDNLGTGLDGRCVDFLRVSYADLCARVLSGGDDEAVLRWCYANGRELNAGDIFIWNQYLQKVGWNDGTSEILVRRKQASGLAGRDEIQTMVDYFDHDEGRKS